MVFSKKFKPSVENFDDSEVQGKQRFIRSKQDNTLFQQIQVKDLKPLLTEDCINYIDADGIAYKTASSVEEDFIEVKNLITGEVNTYKNKTEFRGRTKKISQESVLGTINIKREAVGEKPYKEEDFEITPKKKLKHEAGATIDGVKFGNTLEVMKYYIDEWINAIKIQTQIHKVHCVLGEGDSHRSYLPLPEKYKSNRVAARPLLLKEARDYILEKYPSEMAPEGLETDEVVDAYAFKHYLRFRATGKISGIKTSPDKDALGTAGFLFQGTKSFTFDQPQVWRIDSSDLSVGYIELVKSKVKATGLLNQAMLMVLSDKADHYGSRLTMPKEMQPEDVYGDTAFYKDFITLKTPKDVLQKVVDKFYDFYPKGVKFTAHDGTDIDEDTLWWLQQCFACVYMLRDGFNDKTKIIDLLDRFKVDYEKLVDNNLPKQRTLVETDTIMSKLGELSSKMDTIRSELSKTSGNKPELVQRLKDGAKGVGEMKDLLEEFYE